MSEQQTQFDIAAACAVLADQLEDRRRVPPTGAARLLRALIRGGLDESALLPAAGLALELAAAGREESV